MFITHVCGIIYLRHINKVRHIALLFLMISTTNYTLACSKYIYIYSTKQHDIGI